MIISNILENGRLYTEQVTGDCPNKHNYIVRTYPHRLAKASTHQPCTQLQVCVFCNFLYVKFNACHGSGVVQIDVVIDNCSPLFILNVMTSVCLCFQRRWLVISFQTCPPWRVPSIPEWVLIRPTWANKTSRANQITLPVAKLTLTYSTTQAVTLKRILIMKTCTNQSDYQCSYWRSFQRRLPLWNALFTKKLLFVAGHQ